MVAMRRYNTSSSAAFLAAAMLLALLSVAHSSESRSLLSEEVPPPASASASVVDSDVYPGAANAVQTAQGRLLEWLEQVSDAIQNFEDEVDWHPEELVREMEEFMQMELDTIQSLLDDSQIGRQLQDIMDNMMMLFTPMPGGLAAAEPSSTSSGAHRHLLRERAHHILSNSSPRKLLKSGATADEKWTALDDSITQHEYDGGKEEEGAAEVYLLDGEDPTKYDDMKISELMDLYPSQMEVELLMGVEPEYSWSLTLPATEEDDVEVDEDVEASTKSLLDLDVSDLMVMQPHAVTGFEGQLDLLEDLIEATKRTMARLGDAVAMGIEATDGPIYLDTLWLDIFPDNYDMAPPPSTSPMHSPNNVPGYADNVVHTTVATTEVPPTTTTFAPDELREDKATTVRGVMMSA